MSKHNIMVRADEKTFNAARDIILADYPSFNAWVQAMLERVVDDGATLAAVVE